MRLISTPTLGSSEGARSIWNDEHSMTWTRARRRRRADRGSARRYCRPSATSRPASRRICAISAVVVDLPLVPVMATNGASGARARALAAEEFDVADDLDAGRLGALDRPMRLRDGSAARPARGRARRSRSSRRRRDRPTRSPRRGARARAFSSSSQAATSAPPATSARAVERPGAAEPEQRDLAAAEGRDRRHAHLSFSVDRPTIASTKAMIQKRMTICGSDQPSCSK